MLELETRYSLFSQPGKLRTIAWLNSAFSGSYRETLNNPALDLDIAQTRTGRIKYGYVVSLEQALNDEIGLFGRWSWNDGKTEIMAFTDIDASLSLGASIKGVKWGRPDDVIGIGGAINGISRTIATSSRPAGSAFWSATARSTTATSASSKLIMRTRSTSRSR